MQNSKENKKSTSSFVCILLTIGWVGCAQQRWHILAYLLFAVWAILYFAEFPRHLREAMQDNTKMRMVLSDCLMATTWFCALQSYLSG